MEMDGTRDESLVNPALDINETKLHNSLRQKTWDETITKDSWMVFKVMAEFVDGYEKLAKIGPCVSIFGSARLKPESKYYEMAVEIAEKITKLGFGIITGGGPGIMEAGNKGAFNAQGRSIGLNIDLPFEQHFNPYINKSYSMNFDYFFCQKSNVCKIFSGFRCNAGRFRYIRRAHRSNDADPDQQNREIPHRPCRKRILGRITGLVQSNSVKRRHDC